MSTQAVSSWGRLSALPHQLQALRDRHRLALEDGAATAGPGLAYGNGRSYGDVCLNPGGRLWTTRGLDRFIDFDRSTGVIECEAGVLLDEIITLALPAGWFLPVTPGTRFATIGGAIANDVHGKNHHRAGTLGEHVLGLQLARTDGSRIDCSPTRQAPWLTATIGGLGLTGVIVRARLQLQRVPGPWMLTEAVAYQTLDDFFQLSQASEPDWNYTVSWIDCLHDGGAGSDFRGIFFRANHTTCAAPVPAARVRSVPITPPMSLVNGATLRAFNALYFAANRRKAGPRCQHFLPFFYPLDGLLSWNRIYGPAGFYQYQCVVPRAVQADATAELLTTIRRSGQGSFLAVLKTFSERPAAGLLSFAMTGTTLALDFPNHGDRTEQLFAALDAIVAAAGGRLYPAKDARMSAALFRQGYPGLQAFLPFRDAGISSAMSRRLLQA